MRLLMLACMVSGSRSLLMTHISNCVTSLAAMPRFCARKLNILCMCSLQILPQHFVNSVVIPRCFSDKEEMQIYKHFALTLSDIRISRKITANNEQCRGIYCTGQADT